MKKTFVSIFVALMLVALVVGAGLAAQAAQEKQLRFEGTMQAVEVDEINNPTLYLHGNGSGNATELGQFTLHFEGIVYRDVTKGGISVVAEHLTLANGDKLFALGTGLGVATTTPGINKIVEKFTITGGTGQFVDATGDYTVERLVNLPTGVSSGTIVGNIKLSMNK